MSHSNRTADLQHARTASNALGSAAEIPFHEIKRRSDRANSQPSKFSSPKKDFEDSMIIHERKTKVSPFRLTVSTATVNEPCQACPVCGYDYVHILEVQTHQDHTHVHVHGDECDVTRTTAGSPDRGSSVTIRFVGECQHTFSYTWSFHKGNTRITLHDVGQVEMSQWPSCLWRD